MSKLRVLVGTRKGAFILTADGARKRWKVSGPHFAGWEIYHVKGSTVDPNRIYASQTSAWFGQIIQRSDDGGKSWNTPGSSPEELKGPDGTPKAESNKFVYDGIPSITDCIQNTYRTRMPRSAIVFIASPCTRRGPTHYSCKNTGTSCAAMILAIHGAK